VNSREKTNRFRSRVTRSPVTNITSSDSRLQRVPLQPPPPYPSSPAELAHVLSPFAFYQVRVPSINCLRANRRPFSSFLPRIPRRSRDGNLWICFSSLPIGSIGGNAENCVLADLATGHEADSADLCSPRARAVVLSR